MANTKQSTKSKNPKTTQKTPKKSEGTKNDHAGKSSRRIGWQFLWTLVCVIISTFFLIGVDDAIFGTDNRYLADYTPPSTATPWEGIVARQLSADIFVPIFWGSLITVVEVFILFKAKLFKRSATSAIMIVLIWLLPVILAAVRIASAYAYTF